MSGAETPLTENDSDTKGTETTRTGETYSGGFSGLFVARPVATVLLTLAITLAGALAFFLLPVSPLPQVDFPVISVSATLPGASPETVATSVATPLERHLGQIADVNEMTSQSSVGQSRITLQFGLDRDIDGAARDVQAAINAARADLPASLRSNPTYRKVNPADAPIMILALTSATLSPGQIYDAASTIMQQKLSQISGIGQVSVGGSSLPAVRAELNPHALFKYGVGLEDVRAALAAANANAPKGVVEAGGRHLQIYTNDQIRHAADYQSLILAWRNQAPIRLGDVGTVTDSVEDVRNMGLYNNRPAVLVILFRQPGANIIATVDRVTAALPQLEASIPAAVKVAVAMDRTTTIRAALNDVERTLLIAIALVVLVVFLFLQNGRATLIPAIAVPVSLIATFGAMYLLGYSLDNLSLMALIISTGFVVDDAIVVLENISRHMENGMEQLEATLRGTQEVRFTVVAMSLSLVAVFIPILLMGGIIGRLFREFAITLSVAIMVSLVVSLTLTPMLCAKLLKPHNPKQNPPAQNPPGQNPPADRVGRFAAFTSRFFEKTLDGYRRSLHWALGHGWMVMLVLLLTICLNVYLFIIVPKGLFPQQDTGRLTGSVQADQSTSFQSMQGKLQAFVATVKQDPNIDTVTAFTGGGQTNTANVFVSLKPLNARKLSADQVINKLRRKLSNVAGATLFFQAVQDIRMGGRASNAQYQYTLQSDNLDDLRQWMPKLTDMLQKNPNLSDVNSDQQDKGLELDATFDRTRAAFLGLEASQIDNNLYDAFGQRQVSTIYNPLNQYHVVMELAPRYWQSPEALNDLYVSTSGGAVSGATATQAIGFAATTGSASQNRNAAPPPGANTNSSSTGAAVSAAAETMVPIAAFSQTSFGTTPLAVNHQGAFAAATLSFNLPPGKALGDATDAIHAAMLKLGMPSTIHGSFQGTAKLFQDSLSTMPLLILAALITLYVVLGVLYESYMHPITILSTLPSAGVGATLALLLCGSEFSIIALIGVMLLIGIVKKNAIMMIDFAIEAQRKENISPEAAIFQACLLRFRPIMMTTMAAMLGALPLAIGFGDGAELRRPLGITIVGGLLVSQLLTLYTTPVIYLYLERLRRWLNRQSHRPLPAQSPAQSPRPLESL